MKRCKRLIEIMIMSILISAMIIFMCENSYFLVARNFVKQNINFFAGKKDVIENIFIGILASSLIALIGYILEYKNEKVSLHLKIISTFKIIYSRYYKLIGDKNIESIRNNYLQDEVINEIALCDMEYKRFFNKKKDFYRIAIEIMKWTELYYTNIFQAYSALSQIEEFIKSIKKSIKETEGRGEKFTELNNQSKETLSKIEENHARVLEELDKRINDGLETKKKIDSKNMWEIKEKFGILDDMMAAFTGNIKHIYEMWEGIKK